MDQSEENEQRGKEEQHGKKSIVNEMNEWKSGTKGNK